MKIEKIHLKNYRNISDVLLNVNSNLNIFLGKNGQGKTNILESIYLLGTTSSHRTSSDRELINWNQDKSLIQVLLKRRDYSLKISVFIEGSSKRIEINDNPLSKVSELIGNLNVVLFSPEDLNLVKGGPAIRRNFIDTEVSQVNPYYYYKLQKYNHIVKQRNNLLKDIRDKRGKIELLEMWNEQLIEIGSKIIKKRLNVIDKLKILARLSQRQITNGSENLTIEYSCSFKKELDEKDIKFIFSQDLVNNIDEEIKRGYTLSGPHRDDLILKVNDIDIRKYGSQGQQRTTALALKMAELEFMKSETGEYPVLLLDDVFSELDDFRRNKLLQLIAENIQTFITVTDFKVLGEVRGSYNLFNVEKGSITKER